MDAEGFNDLIQRLAEAWATPDAGVAAALFTTDAVYMEPPDVQFFTGRDQIESYFSPLTSGTYLDLHHVSFDAAAQRGAIEFSFGERGSGRADHGVAIVAVKDGLIAEWREYHRPGPERFADFTSTDGPWEWHIGNYP